MKTVIISKNKVDVNRVFSARIRESMKGDFEVLPEAITKANIDEHIDYLRHVEFAFATWGMESYTVDEIKKYFPALKSIFYAAGSVQHFAKPFLECGISVHSAWQANAVPVAEYVYAQILLANKGYYGASRKCKMLRYPALKYAENHGGNYNKTVGIIGCGMIGGMVCKYLKQHQLNVMVYDPYISEERLEELGAARADSMKEVFAKCNVISNHLPNKEELNKVINYELLSLMQANSTFINTGRGRQVDEKALSKVLARKKSITALLDVTYPEPPSVFSKLMWQKNAILTPHIAGSLGVEVERMAEYMIDECKRMQSGEKAKYAVKIDMLQYLA